MLLYWIIWRIFILFDFILFYFFLKLKIALYRHIIVVNVLCTGEISHVTNTQYCVWGSFLLLFSVRIEIEWYLRDNSDNNRNVSNQWWNKWIRDIQNKEGFLCIQLILTRVAYVVCVYNVCFYVLSACLWL